MSKDIRSYFNVLPKTGTSPKTFERTPRKRVVISSDEDEDKLNSVKKRKTSKSSDPKISSPKKNGSHKTKDTIVSAADFFGTQPVKQKELVTATKKACSSPAISTEKAVECVSPPRKRAKSNDAFEQTLNDLDDAFDVDVLDESIREAEEKIKNKKSKNDCSYTDPDQDKFERRKQGAALYQKYLNRSGPVNLGKKPLPDGKAGCLKNMCFLRTGVLDSLDGDMFKELIEKYGGRTVTTVSRKVDYLVLGTDAGPAKLSKAESLNIKTLSEDELLDLILSKSELPLKYVKESADNTSETVVKCPEKSYRKSILDVLEKNTKQKPIRVGSHSITSCKKVEKSELSKNYPPNLCAKKENDDPSEPSTSRSDRKRDMDQHSGSAIVKTASLPAIKIASIPTEKENVSFTERYKPTSMTKIVGQQANVEKLHKWLKDWFKNHSGNANAKSAAGYLAKCALLSGPPGVGKTTTAHLVSRELGFDVVEYNASDTRSKTFLKEQIQRQLNSKSIRSFIEDGSAPTSKHVVVMDEVDGMAGNEDRGGVQELIQLIKSSGIPIICMCNDRHHQKIRSLSNYCYDIPFIPANVLQIKGAMKSVCAREGVKISNDVLENLIETSRRDIRQILNHLSMMSATSKLDQASIEDGYKVSEKDVVIGSWQVVRKQLDSTEYSKMTFKERSRLFFFDYSMAPLFFYENYLNVRPNNPKEFINNLAEATNSISFGDTIEKQIRSKNNWSLLDSHGIFATQIPSYYINGSLGQVNFPKWLGKNSSATKSKRIYMEIRAHTRSVMSTSRSSIILDYAEPMRKILLNHLQKENVQGAVDFACGYNLLKSDCDNLMQIGQWSRISHEVKLPSSIKAAFTRTYNKSHHMLPYAVESAAVRLKKSRVLNEDDQDDEGAADDNNEEAVDATPMIRMRVMTTSEKNEKEAKKAKSKVSKPKKAAPKKK